MLPCKLFNKKKTLINEVILPKEEGMIPEILFYNHAGDFYVFITQSYITFQFLDLEK
jgi:hypothetical protein